MSQQSPALQAASIQWHENVPFSVEFNDYYFSKNNCLGESYYVSIEANNLPKRWHEFEQSQRDSFSILETGFGTGLNFLTTAQHWIEFQQKTGPNYLEKLIYTSIEGFPLCFNDFKRIIDNWSKEFTISRELIEFYPPLIEGVYSFRINSIELNLMFMPLDKALSQFEPKGSQLFDCLYLDGFSPSKNQTMWNSQKLRQISFLCKTHSTFSTFTSVSSVRRSLNHCGYKIIKIDGFAGKRDMLTGILKRESNPDYKSRHPWFEITRSDSLSNNIVIIGAGVAGCATAYSLAKQGIASTIIDANCEPGGTISNFPVSCFSPLLTADFNLMSQFYWHAYHLIAQYLMVNPNVFHKFCGLCHIADSDIRHKMLSTAHQLLKNTGLDLTWLKQEHSQAITNLHLQHESLFVNHGGVINAKSLCQSLLKNPLIKTKFEVETTELNRTSQHWIIHTSKQRFESTQLILCTGAQSKFIDEYNLCSMGLVSGQITQLPLFKPADSPANILNNGHYIIPSLNGSDMVTGSNFDKQNNSEYQATTIFDIDNLMNIKGLNKKIDNLLEKHIQKIQTTKSSSSHFGVRLTSRDHLPIIGAVPDIQFYKAHYTDFIKTGKLKSSQPAVNIPGLFVNTAHGSRGVTASLLSGEILTSIIAGKQLPIPTRLFHAIHPARFFVRDIVSESG